MNVEKLKRLQAQVRIGGKGTPRRKKKVMHQTAATDDKKLQSSLKKLSVSTIPGIEEVNIIKDDLSVIHFNNPKAQASLSANTFAVTGHGENKKIVEMLPEILPQLGQETVVQLRCFANCLSNNQKGLSSVAEEDDVPTLVSDFDEASKHEVGLLKNNTEKKITESAASKNKENINIDATISKEIINAGDVAASGETAKQKDAISNKNKSGQNVKHEAPLKNKDKSNANESKENKKSKKQDKSSSKSAVKKAGEELISATTQLLAEMMPIGNETNVTPKSKDKKSTKNQDLAAANNIKNAKSEKSQLPDAEKPKSMKETKSSTANKSKPLESDQQNEKALKITESAKNVTAIKTATVEAAPPITAVGASDKVIAPQATVPVEKKSEKSNNLVDQQKAKPDMEKPSKIENLKALDPTKPLEAAAPAAAPSKTSEDAKSPVKLQPMEAKQPLIAATSMDIGAMPKSVEAVKEEKGKTSAKLPQKPTEIEKSKKIVEQSPTDMKKTVDQSIPPTMNLAEIIKSDEMTKNQSAVEAPIEKTKSQNIQEVKPPKQIEAAANKKDDIKALEMGKTPVAPVKTPEATQVTAAVSFSEAAKLPAAVEKLPAPLEAQKVIDSKQEVSPNATKPAEPAQKQTEAAKLLTEIAVPPPVSAKSPEVSQAPVKAPEIIQKANTTPETAAKITEIPKAPVELKASPPSIDEKPKVEAMKQSPTPKDESKPAPPPEPVKEAIAVQAADKAKVTDATKSPKKTNETKKTAPMKQQPDTPKALEMKPSSQEAKKTDQIMSTKPKQPSPKPQQQSQSKAAPTTSSTPIAPGVPPPASSSSSSSSPIKQQKTAKQPEKSQTTTTNQPKPQPKSSSTSLTSGGGTSAAPPPKQPAPNKSQTTQPAKGKQMSPPKLTEATVATTGNKKTESATVENKTIQKDSAGEMKSSTKQPSPKPRAPAKQQPPPPAQQQQQQPAKNPAAAAKPMQENVAKKQQSQPQTELPSTQN